MSLQVQNKVPTQAELNSLESVAKIASSNPYWRKLGGNGKPEEVTATLLSIMLLARELGFSPMQAVSGGINNIQGKFEISARLMNQAIRNRGHKVRVVLLTDEICKIWGKRKDTQEEMEVVYHIEEALRSGLVKEGGAWKKTPQDMLFARAISRLARRLYPDCIGGAYVEGELQETIQGKVVTSIEVPNQNEMDKVEEEEVVELDLPSDVDSERVDQYLHVIAEQGNRKVVDIKKRAAKNIEGFIETFRKWQDKQYPPQEVLEA